MKRLVGRLHDPFIHFLIKRDENFPRESLDRLFPAAQTLPAIGECFFQGKEPSEFPAPIPKYIQEISRLGK